MFPGSMLQGGSSTGLQGSSPTLQAAPTTIQGSSPNLQPAVDPTYATFSQPVSTGPTAAQIAAAQAAAAETARLTGVRTAATGSQNDLFGGARVQMGDIANTYDTNNRNFITSMMNGQDDINSGLVNNALNLRRSMASIAQGVRQGVRSGGVMLGNINALDSGAAEAIARAYAMMGNQQAGDASNQAELKRGELQGSQVKLNRSRDDKLAEFATYENTEPNRVGQKLGSDLGTLERGTEAAAGFHADMAQKDSIINEAIARLHQIDADRAARLSGITQIDAGEQERRAVAADQAGQAGVSPFAVADISTSAPLGIGAEISQLPIFRSRKTA